MSATRNSEADSYEIRRPGDADAEGIRQLFELSLDSGRSEAFREWKHDDNPFGETFWLIAEAEGEIVGARAFMQWEWMEAGRRWRAVRAVDTATHPDWRRKGIFTNLTTRMVQLVRDDGVDFIFNTPNAASRPGYLKMGWEVVARVPIWVRPLRPVGLLRGLTNMREEPPTEAIRYSDSNVDELLAAVSTDSVVQSAFDGETRIHTDRIGEYLQWRYAAIPDIEYRSDWRRDGDATAFAVHRRRKRRGLVELMLCEVAATPGPKGVRLLRGLLSDLIGRAGADYAIGCAARNTTEMWGLLTAGFLCVPKIGPTLVWRPLSEPARGLKLGEWPYWRCSIGDLEIF